MPEKIDANNIKMFALTPVYSSQNSFGNKACVIKALIDETKEDTKENNNYILFSYDTAVCSICSGKVQTHEMGSYSATTDKHIKEFILQFASEDELKRVQKEAKINRQNREEMDWGDR